MAHRFPIKNKGFTLLEMALVILMLSFALVVIGNIYPNIIRTSVLLDRKIRALENINLGTEKIWRLLKYSWSIEIQNSGRGISFKDNNCNPKTIRLWEYNILIDNTELFDPNLVKVNDFRVAVDSPSPSALGERFAYFQYAPKVIVLYYNLEIKERTGTSSLIFQQAVAPLNSLYLVNKCP
jgi:prepilin-type N-terminal cleavage/methylation domain-containing protein